MPRIYKPDAQAVRYKRSEEALREDGGKRLNIRLRGKAMKGLAKLMRRWKMTQTEAVNKLLEDL